MERTLADRLVECLQQHSRIRFEDPSKVASDLGRYDVPQTGAIELDRNKHRLSEGGVEYCVEPRRLLSGQGEPITLKEKMINFVARHLNSYSSDLMTRDIHGDVNLLDLIRNNNPAIALLAKVREFDQDQVASYPVLAIPGAERNELVSHWEGRYRLNPSDDSLLFPL